MRRIVCAVMLALAGIAQAQEPPPPMFITLSWQDIATEDYYLVEIQKDGGPWTESLRVVHDVTMTKVVGLFVGSLYCVRVVPMRWDGAGLPGHTEGRCSNGSVVSTGAPLDAQFFQGSWLIGTPAPIEPDPEPEPEPDPVPEG